MTVTTQWSGVEQWLQSAIKPYWIPEEDLLRLQAYSHYDDLYWNEPTQFELRVLEGEESIYVPNARVIVDTTAHYILKGLDFVSQNQQTQEALTAFMNRERFLSRFHTAKHRGVAIGDFAFHLRGNPYKPAGSRLSINSVDPSSVFPVWDEDNPDKMVKCHLVKFFVDDEKGEERVQKLTYELVEDEVTHQRLVFREEGIYSLKNKWWGREPELVKVIYPRASLDPRITSIPVYWFQNKTWDIDQYGSSELRGFDSLLYEVSQGATDVAAALALEGLGVYATDGGRPVDDQGNETDWEVAPGKVMEVPTGSYFRRLEGVTSITPATDNIEYIERKLREASSLTDVALGTVEASVAQSGIALAIRFMPTLAKIEDRDRHGVDKLRQFWYDWCSWYDVYEGVRLTPDIEPVLGEKLPKSRTEVINELNNLKDRRIISAETYRMLLEKELGYSFDPNEGTKVLQEIAAETEARGQVKEEVPENSTVNLGNQSNNAGRPNESAGTEAQPTQEA